MRLHCNTSCAAPVHSSRHGNTQSTAELQSPSTTERARLHVPRLPSTADCTQTKKHDVEMRLRSWLHTYKTTTMLCRASCYGYSLLSTNKRGQTSVSPSQAAPPTTAVSWQTECAPPHTHTTHIHTCNRGLFSLPRWSHLPHPQALKAETGSAALIRALRLSHWKAGAGNQNRLGPGYWTATGRCHSSEIRPLSCLTRSCSAKTPQSSEMPPASAQPTQQSTPRAL